MKARKDHSVTLSDEAVGILQSVAKLRVSEADALVFPSAKQTPLSEMTLSCGKLTPAGADEIMTLLRAGSQQICIAPEVQTTLRNLIVTKAADLPDTNVPLEKRTQAVAAVHLSYDMTTLESFDAAVSRAMCNTVKIGSINGDSKSSFRVIFAVSPSAEDANSFVVSANVDEPHAFATTLVGDEINDIAAKAYVEQQERDNTS